MTSGPGKCGQELSTRHSCLPSSCGCFGLQPSHLRLGSLQTRCWGEGLGHEGHWVGWPVGGSAGVPGEGHFCLQAKEVQLTLAQERRLWSEHSGVGVGSWLQAELGPGLWLRAQTRGFCVPLRSQPPWLGQDGSVCSAAQLSRQAVHSWHWGHVRGSWRPCRWPYGQGSQAC